MMKNRTKKRSMIVFFFFFAFFFTALVSEVSSSGLEALKANEDDDADMNLFAASWPSQTAKTSEAKDEESVANANAKGDFVTAKEFRELPRYLTRDKVRSSAIFETKNRGRRKAKAKVSETMDVGADADEDDLVLGDAREEVRMIEIDRAKEYLEDPWEPQNSMNKRKSVEILLKIAREDPKCSACWRELGISMQMERATGGRNSQMNTNESNNDRNNKNKNSKNDNNKNVKKEKVRKMNEKKAVSFLKRAAELGDTEAHFELAFLYSTGLGGFLERDERLAMMHHFFAAKGGDARSHLALGHRHWKGRYAPKSCQASVLYLHPVALKTVEPIVAPLMGDNNPKGFDYFRLSRDMKSPKQLKRQKDVVTYYQYAADLGNAEAQNAVGHAYFFGTKGLEVNYVTAVKYLDLAATQGNAEAMSSLGHAYANGLGVAQNNETALRWFKEAKKLGSTHASYGLAYMYLSGFGVDKNPQEAVKELMKAAERGSSWAQFHLGALHVRGVSPLARDYTKAITYFGLAGAHGHVLASYNLAMMQLGGLGAPIACSPAVDKLKVLGERSSTVTTMMENAREHFLRKNYKESLYAYAKASEMGVELAQVNAAYIVERNFGGVLSYMSKEARIKLSLYFHELAADQGNVLSLLTIGDAHYGGWIPSYSSPAIPYAKSEDWVGPGVPEDLFNDENGEDVRFKEQKSLELQSNYEKAAQVYRRAAGLRSATAMFNLGRMHEVGKGVAKDYHLAKRFYDSCLAVEPDAKYIIKFALWQLKAREWMDEKEWNKKDLLARASDVFKQLLLLRPGLFTHSFLEYLRGPSVIYGFQNIFKVFNPNNAPPDGPSINPSAPESDAEPFRKNVKKIFQWGRRHFDLAMVILLSIALVITLGLRSILGARQRARLLLNRRRRNN
jgi:SEL1 protein